MQVASWSRRAWVEFCLVICITLGWAIWGSVSAMIHVYAGITPPADVPSAQSAHGNWLWLVHVIVTEMVLILPFAVILRWRGWRLAEFPLRFTPVACLQGIGIALATMLGMIAIVLALRLIVPINPCFDSVGRGAMPGLAIILALSVLNGAFEETILLGYVVRFFERLGLQGWPRAAIIVSTFIRASYHTYQGLAAAIAIGAMGAAFSWLYVRYRNLWVFIFAHMLIDFFTLLPSSQG